MSFRDRIREFRRVRAGTLRPHPRNWRRHPPAQRAALQAILNEVGYADALLARELPDGSLQLIDGHLRAETSLDQDVPVLVLDVSAEEADKLLTVLDPIAALAETDRATLAKLANSLHDADESLQKLCRDLLDEEDEAQAAQADATPTTCESVAVPELFQILVDCRDEADQRALFERLTAEGYACRVLTL